MPSALAFLMNNEPDIVRNFLLKTLQLQGWEKRIDLFMLGKGAMPASFKVIHNPTKGTESIMADFGESAIGRVAPVDSGFWWIILLRAYTKSTGDLTLAETPECQKGMRLILTLCLAEGFDTFPTLLCADGCSMIDRQMVITILILNVYINCFYSCFMFCLESFLLKVCIGSEREYYLFTTLLWMHDL